MRRLSTSKSHRRASEITRGPCHPQFFFFLYSLLSPFIMSQIQIFQIPFNFVMLSFLWPQLTHTSRGSLCKPYFYFYFRPLFRLVLRTNPHPEPHKWCTSMGLQEAPSRGKMGMDQREKDENSFSPFKELTSEESNAWGMIQQQNHSNMLRKIQKPKPGKTNGPPHHNKIRPLNRMHAQL